MKLKFNERNPRRIEESAIGQAIKSIIGFPEMLKLNGIVHSKGVIYAGEVRYRALQEILQFSEVQVREHTDGFPEPRKSELEQFWSVIVKTQALPAEWFKEVDFKPDLLDQFSIRDNTHAGEWDYSLLADVFDPQQLKTWGVTVDWGGAAPRAEASFSPNLRPSSAPSKTTDQDFDRAQEKIDRISSRPQSVASCECPNCKYTINYSL